jgi:hypothetical protein
MEYGSFHRFLSGVEASACEMITYWIRVGNTVAMALMILGTEKPFIGG